MVPFSLSPSILNHLVEVQKEVDVLEEVWKEERKRTKEEISKRIKKEIGKEINESERYVSLNDGHVEKEKEENGKEEQKERGQEKKNRKKNHDWKDEINQGRKSRKYHESKHGKKSNESLSYEDGKRDQDSQEQDQGDWIAIKKQAQQVNLELKNLKTNFVNLLKDARFQLETELNQLASELNLDSDKKQDVDNLKSLYAKKAQGELVHLRNSLCEELKKIKMEKINQVEKHIKNVLAKSNNNGKGNAKELSAIKASLKAIEELVIDDWNQWDESTSTKLEEKKRTVENLLEKNPEVRLLFDLKVPNDTTVAVQVNLDDFETLQGELVGSFENLRDELLESVADLQESEDYSNANLQIALQELSKAVQANLVAFFNPHTHQFQWLSLDEFRNEKISGNDSSVDELGYLIDPSHLNGDILVVDLEVEFFAESNPFISDLNCHCGESQALASSNIATFVNSTASTSSDDFSDNNPLLVENLNSDAGSIKFDVDVVAVNSSDKEESVQNLQIKPTSIVNSNDKEESVQNLQIKPTSIVKPSAKAAAHEVVPLDLNHHEKNNQLKNNSKENGDTLESAANATKKSTPVLSELVDAVEDSTASEKSTLIDAEDPLAPRYPIDRALFVQLVQEFAKFVAESDADSDSKIVADELEALIRDDPVVYFPSTESEASSTSKLASQAGDIQNAEGQPRMSENTDANTVLDDQIAI